MGCDTYHTYLKEIKNLIEYQNSTHKEINETKLNAVKSAYETIKKEANISKLTEADISYIVAMKKADPSNENRKAIAEKYNYNLDVLNLLNAGITKGSLTNAQLPGAKAFSVNDSKGSTVDKNYGVIISHPLEKAVNVFSRNMNAQFQYIRVDSASLYVDQVIKWPKKLQYKSSNGPVN